MAYSINDIAVKRKEYERRKATPNAATQDTGRIVRDMALQELVQNSRQSQIARETRPAARPKATTPPVLKPADAIYNDDFRTPTKNYGYTRDNVLNYLDRARELSQRPSWTDDERAEVREINKYLVDSAERGKYSKTLSPKTYREASSIGAALRNMDNPIGVGLASGLGATSLARAATAIADKQAAKDMRRQEAFAAQNNPTAYGIANTAGSIASFVGLGSAIPGAGILNSAATMGAAQAAKGIGDVATGERSAGQYAADIAVEAGAGAVGGALARGLTTVAGNFITRKGLQFNPIARGALSALAGGSYAGGRSGSKQIARVLGYDDGQELTPQQLAQDVLIGAAFGTINFILKGGVQRTLNEGRAAAGEPEPVVRSYFKGVKDEDLARVRRQLAKQLHPDNGGDKAMFAAMEKEYEGIIKEISGAAANRTRNAYNAAAKAKASGDMATYQSANEEFKASKNQLIALLQETELTEEATQAIEALAAITDVDADIPTADIQPVPELPVQPTETPAQPVETVQPTEAPAAPVQPATEPAQPKDRIGKDARSSVYPDEAAEVYKKHYPESGSADDIVYYDENMRKAYQAGVNGESLKGLMTEESDFGDFYMDNTEAVDEIFRAGYNHGVEIGSKDKPITAKQEADSIKEQVRNNSGELDNMPVVSRINARLDLDGRVRSEKAGIISKLFEKIKNKIAVKGVGDVIIDEKRINDSLRYIKTDLEYLAYQAIPDVLQNGIEIGSHDNHKGRGYDTITIAAPVQFEPPAVEKTIRGNVAVVIKQTTGNHYKVHRVILPDEVIDENKKQTRTVSGAELPVATTTESASVSSEYAENEGNSSAVATELSNRNIPQETETVKAEAQTSNTPQTQIATAVNDMLKADNPGFSSGWLFDVANKAYGGTQAEGAYTVKDAYDGMELGINKYLLESEFVKYDGNGSLRLADDTLTKIEALLQRIPTQTKRTEEMESYQQFSTPPTIAFVAARTAKISPNDVVLEPSAGIGGLALWGKAWGAKVYGNELSKRRLAFLNELGLDGTFNENAEQINNVLPDDIKPTVVIMNPPFSSTAGRMAKNSTANAKRHIEQALERLEEGGRLVAILGRGMADDAPAFKSWWNELRKEYNIRANVRIDGSNYKKYGTTFDDQLVVIDKNGATTGTTKTGEFKDLHDLLRSLEGIRDERTYVSGSDKKSVELVSGLSGGRSSMDGKTAVSVGGQHDEYDTGKLAGTDKSGASAEVDGNSGGHGRGILGRNGASGAERAEGRGSVRPVGRERVSDSEEKARTDDSKRAGQSVSNDELQLVKRERQPSTKTVNIDSVFTSYAPEKVSIKGAKPHPGNLAESAAMGAVSLPNPTYTPHLPQDLIDSGTLSDAQLENVVYAGQAHEQKLPNGNRKGYFIGDGTGVGKGRQIAAVILDNFNQGRNKAVWISKNKDLIPDAQRDWKALGGDPKEIHDLGKIKLGTPINIEKGILFGTYNTLGSQKENGIDRIVKWLGKEFDGVIAFDEAHEMKNGVRMRGSRGMKDAVAKALWGIELQRALPNARVLYATATGASAPENLVYLDRLGLWGEGTAFSNFEDFYTKISSGGLAAMELVARDMKSMGVYLSRSISYDGVEYDTVEHQLTPIQNDIYNKMSDAWQVVLQNINEALKITGQDKNGKAKGAAASAFWGGLQRFYNQVITSMSMPSVIEDIQKQLDEGRSIVIQLVNTNAEQAKRAIAKNAEEGGDLESLDLTPSETLIQLLEKSFPVQMYEEYTDEDGNVRSRPVLDSKGEPVLDKKAVALRDQLIEEVGQMQVPDGPLEMLLDAFGADQVAEVTGRKRRVVYKKQSDGSMKRVIEKRSDAMALADADLFQSGKKRILVFSEKGGTGKSYHADLTAKNQQQRVHYVLQPGWKADAAIQGLGRTHRTNEASAPIYKLVTTNVMGQKRFTSTIARRLNQMGALTKGQRDAGSGIFSEKDNLENPIAMDALSRYYRTADKALLDKLGIKIYDQNGIINESAADLRDISKFLNRILALNVDEQNEVFEDFYTVFEQMMDAAIANGTVEMGMESYKADKIELVDEKVIRKDESGADTKYVQMNVYNKPRIVAYSQLENAHKGYMGVYRLEDGSVRAVYDIGNSTDVRGNVSRKYRLDTPIRGKFSTYVEKTLNEKTTKLPKNEWEDAWKKEISQLPEYDESTLHLLTGTLLPVWDKLPETNTRVMRVVTNDGKQYLGRVINPDQIDGVLRGLGTNRTQKQYTTDELMDSVLNGNKEVALRDNKWKLNKRKVSGEWRIEVTGNNLWAITRIAPGVISERINYDYRYFIPTGEKGKEVLEQLIKNNPVVDVRAAASKDADSVDFSRTASAASNANEWTANRVGDADKKPMRLSDIIGKIEHDFGLNITAGHVRGAGVMGRFSRNDKGIRTKIANDLPVAAHELGHYFDNKYGITESGLSKDIKDELEDALGEGKAAYSPKKYHSEGMAEYIRKYLQNREVAKIDYPKFTDHFLKCLDPEDLVKLNVLADEINAYYSLDADSAASSIRLREEGGTDFRTYGEKIQDIGDDVYQAWVDSNHAIKRFEREIGGRAYTLATNAAYSDAMAGRIIQSDLTDPNGRYVGPGLKEALHGVNVKNKAEYRAFNEYLAVRHGVEWLANDLRVFADDRKNSTTWMNNRREALEAQYPEFEAAADRVFDFVKRFTQTWGVETGLISQAQMDALNEKYPEYVPFFRAVPKERRGNAAKRGFANQTSPVKRAKGSGYDIVAPVDNIIDMIVTYVNTATRNNVVREMRNAAAKSGDATFMEQIPTPMVPKSLNMAGLKERLQDELDENLFGGRLNTDAWNLVSGMVDSISDIMTQFSRGKAHGDIITVMVNGEPEFWKVNDPLLLESLTSMRGTQLPAILEAYGKTTRLMTSMITGSNPIWSVFSNAPRDLQTLAVYAKDKTPAGYAKLIRDIGLGYVNAFNKKYRGDNSIDPIYAEYLAMGGAHASAYSADANLAKKYRKDFTKTKARRVLEMLNPLEAVSFISDTIEQGPRFATYKACRAKGMDPQESFFEAMDVTINFRKSGANSRTLNKIVPFFNANVQGTDKFYRHFTADDVKGNRKKAAITRLLMWFAASAVVAGIDYALNHGDEESTKNYQRLSNYTKNSFFCIPLGDGKYFTIPKGRELLLPASFFERTLEYGKGNHQAYSEFYGYFTDNMLPSIVSDVAQYPVNVLNDGAAEAFNTLLTGTLGSLGAVGIMSNLHANKDFIGRPIVSQTLSYYDPARQYNANTSKLAKTIGEKFNLSPVQIDYFGNNFLSYPWKMQRALFPVDEKQRDLTLGVSNTYLKDNIYSQDLVNWLYDKKDKSSALAKDSDEINKLIDSKMDTNMTTFYSRFNKLNKDSDNEVESRKARQAVLTMIQEYRDISDLGNPQEVERVYDIVREAKDTGLLPKVMADSVKLEKEKIPLTDKQYVEYQLKYNGYYWDYANEYIDLNAPMEEQIRSLASAASIAAEQAELDMLEKVSGYTQSGSVSAGTRIQFETEISKAKQDDKKASKAEVIDILDVMIDAGLVPSEAAELYSNQVDDEKFEIWNERGGDIRTYFAATEAKDDGNQDGVVAWLKESGLSKQEQLEIWTDVTGYKESTFEKKMGYK